MRAPFYRQDMLDRFVTLGVLAILAAAAWFGFRVIERDYPQNLPWTPLVIEQPIGWSTKTKIAALQGDPSACLALFEGSSFQVEAIPDRRDSEQCGWSDAVTLREMSAAYSPGTVRMACPLAATLAIWEENVVQPAAREIFGSDVTEIEQLGTYSCRRIAGSERWSTHAQAKAIDISAFRLADGQRISLAGDWNGTGKPSQFLHRIRDEGCAVFGTLLGPDYNAAHRDHFHLQQAGFGTCR